LSYFSPYRLPPPPPLFPTRRSSDLHIPFAAEIAGLRVEPGAYSIYTVPGEDEWEVIVNRSVSQWGIETQYTPEVRAQEVGRATVDRKSTRLNSSHVKISYAVFCLKK